MSRKQQVAELKAEDVIGYSAAASVDVSSDLSVGSLSKPYYKKEATITIN